MSKAATVQAIYPVNNDAAVDIEAPYIVRCQVQGTAAFLYHRWSVEAVEEKSKAAKGSKSKKTDNLESYVWRDSKGTLCIPSEYFRMSIIGAAKFKQDPRSPRKSAMDLFKAGIVVLEELASVGKQEWDYLDRRRVQIQRNGVTRVRPALLSGWQAEFNIQVLLPEYISPELFNEVLQMAGRLIGVGDFRPTYGRFQVVKFERL